MELRCIKDLEENSFEVYGNVSDVLLKLLDNVIKFPTNPKYRHLRIGNAIVSQTLIPAIGAMECLFSIGFKEDGDGLTLPNSVPIKNLQNFRDELQLRKSLLQNRTRTSENLASSSTLSSSERAPSSSAGENHMEGPGKSCVSGQNEVKRGEVSYQSLPSTSSTLDPRTESLRNLPSSQESDSHNSKDKLKRMSGSQRFLNQIDIIFNKMSSYEDKKLLAKAREIIPSSQFVNNVAKQQESSDSFTQELLLLELLQWFKNSFFSWVDQPHCPSCQGPTVFVGQSPSLDNSISRIEEYKCEKCGIEVPFPRYEDLEILLQSRKGRCGEWANVFTLFCRALNWDTRYVYDVTDHVWTEVYSERQKRWLHCDPCEAALDTPLMYENGWGKKLSYVIAFSFEEVQDVTWRYSNQFQEVCSRRKAVSEQDLIFKILSLTKTRQTSLPPERTQFLLRRRVEELAEFLSPPKATGEYGGRISGSEEWRVARGELNKAVRKPLYVWRPTPASIENLIFQVEYSTSLNKYIDRNGRQLVGWENGVYTAEAISRKEESDWKMVYLARTEGSAMGKIEWKFNFESCGVAVDQIRIKCPHTVYEDGKVQWYLCDEKGCQKIPDGKEFVTQADPSVFDFTLRSELENGRGNHAWQHAQLFRQSIDSSDFIFTICFTLKFLEGKNV